MYNYNVPNFNFSAQLALDLYNDESLTLNDENRDAR
jgi:hypothetical protein